MSKKKRTLLITAGIALLFAVCCVCVYFYAQYLINKPKFEIPEEVPLASATAMPETDDAKLAYAENIFSKSFTDETEITKTADISYENVVTDMSDADKSVLSFTAEELKKLALERFETYENKHGEEITSIPAFVLGLQDIDNYEMTVGQTDESGEITDENYYFFSFSREECNGDYTPSVDTTYGIGNKISAFSQVKDSLLPDAEVSCEEIKLKAYSVTGKTDRVYDWLDYIEFSHTYSVTVNVKFAGNYAALGEKTINFDLTVTEKYRSKHYGARFTDKALYMNPGESVSVPVSVIISDEATGDEYKLTFTSSDESIVKVEDEIIEAVASSDKQAEITITLEYKGHTYTDTCLVTVTDLEVE